jgi:hypothetical protein
LVQSCAPAMCQSDKTSVCYGCAILDKRDMRRKIRRVFSIVTTKISANSPRYTFEILKYLTSLRTVHWLCNFQVVVQRHLDHPSASPQLGDFSYKIMVLSLTSKDESTGTFEWKGGPGGRSTKRPNSGNFYSDNSPYHLKSRSCLKSTLKARSRV